MQSIKSYYAHFCVQFFSLFTLIPPNSSSFSVFETCQICLSVRLGCFISPREDVESSSLEIFPDTAQGPEEPVWPCFGQEVGIEDPILFLPPPLGSYWYFPYIFHLCSLAFQNNFWFCPNLPVQPLIFVNVSCSLLSMISQLKKMLLFHLSCWNDKVIIFP